MKRGKKVIFLINTLAINWNKKKKTFYYSLNFFLASTISNDVQLLDIRFEE